MLNNNFLKLHLSVVLAGFTGIFGKLIDLNEGLLVWYRLLLSFLILLVIMLFAGKLPRDKDFRKIMGIGVLLALHFLFFYGSIKYANVSVGVVCYSLVGFFTAIFEPVIAKRKFSMKELAYSLIAVAGILLIFNLDVSFRFGIILGVIASAVAAVFNIVNTTAGAGKSSKCMLFYEFLGGLLFTTAIMPLYLHFNPVQSVLPALADWGWLFILAFFCTIGQYILHIQALKALSAFTVSLSGNLEPLYGIIAAVLFVGEAQQLTMPFYIGMTFIILSVFLQSLGGVSRQAHLSLYAKFDRRKHITANPIPTPAVR
ncbi:MAG: EamA family transporter [Heliobacteriaceae bacterium]|nr:EamA family transporter [Heliobacteriaceae bacterium]